MEEKYLFPMANSQCLEDSDFTAKPFVLVLGQYSTGKTSVCGVRSMSGAGPCASDSCRCSIGIDIVANVPRRSARPVCGVPAQARIPWAKNRPGAHDRQICGSHARQRRPLHPR